MSNSEAPKIKEQKGPWDERVAYAILITPFALLTLGVVLLGVLTLTGTISINVGISGSLSASNVFNSVVAPLILLFGALLGLTWLLALMKVFGANPVVWVVQRIANAATNYNPPQD